MTNKTIKRLGQGKSRMELEGELERLTAALEKIRDLAGHGAEGWAVIDCQIEASEALAAVEEKDNE